MKKFILLFLVLFQTTCFAYGTNGCDKNSTYMLHMEGAKGGTTFTESDCPGDGVLTITDTSNISTDTTQVKFGKTAAVFDGGTRYLSSATNAAFNWSADFAVDCWVYTNVGTSDTQFRRVWSNGDAVGSTQVDVDMDASATMIAILGGAVQIQGTTSINDSKWHHVLLERTGTAVKLFLDGKQEGSTWTNSPATNITGNTFYIGIYPGTLTTGRWNGYIDEFRISKGVSRFTLTFPVPSTPYCSGCEMVGVLNE